MLHKRRTSSAGKRPAGFFMLLSGRLFYALVQRNFKCDQCSGDHRTQNGETTGLNPNSFAVQHVPTAVKKTAVGCDGIPSEPYPYPGMNCADVPVFMLIWAYKEEKEERVSPVLFLASEGEFVLPMLQQPDNIALVPVDVHQAGDQHHQQRPDIQLLSGEEENIKKCGCCGRD